MRPIRYPLAFRTGAGVVVLAVVLGAGWSAVPAVASPRATLHSKTSRYPFAGYLTAPTTITSSSATVVLPSVTCTKKITAVSAGATVYDAGTGNFSSAMAYVGCSAKKELLSALVQVDNTYTVPTVTMHPGDTVALSVTCGASGISVTVDDQTTSSVGTGSSSTPETCTQGEIGDFAAAFSNKSIASIPAFGTISFTNAMINGGAIGLLDPSAAQLNEGKKNVITPGPLTNSGTAFVTTQGS